MKTAREILDNHLMSFGKGDINGVLSDYAPKAIFFTPAGTLVGLDAISPLFERLIAEFAKPGSSFELKNQSVEGNYAYILWSAETAENTYELATDTFFVKEGKIVAQSFAAKILPKPQSPSPHTT